MQAIHVGASTQAGGDLMIHKANAVVKAPLRWKLKNIFRHYYTAWLIQFIVFGKPVHLCIPYISFPFIRRWLGVHVIAPVGKLFGISTHYGQLQLQVRRFYDDLEREHFVALRRAGLLEEAEAYARFKTYWEDYGTVSNAVITDVFVAALVDAMDNGGGVGITAFKYHGIGTGSNAESASDTALQTESTTALNPDSTRGTGAQTQPSANIYRSTATLTADAQIVAREHMLFNQAATGGGTGADRSVFATVTVEIGESIQTQYSMTHNSGG